MPRWLNRFLYGYDHSDLKLLELKISSGLNPEDAPLTEYEGRALADMPKARLMQLVNEGRGGLNATAYDC